MAAIGAEAARGESAGYSSGGMEIGYREAIQALVEHGAVIRARLLDGFETPPTPVYWLDYHEGVLRYGRAEAAAQIHDYGIDRLEGGGEAMIFHTSGETSVACLIVEPAPQGAVLHALHQWKRKVESNNHYPEDGWRFGG